MEHVNFPNQTTWQERSKWFDDLIEEKMSGSYLVSEQASALCSELFGVFCIGAWYSVIILSVAIIDAQLRECETFDFEGNTYDLARHLDFNPDFDWLRKKRNKLVHLNVDDPIANLDDYSDKKDDLEKDAKKAIELVFEAFFLSPGT
jgi:hypothetical protein